MRNQSDRLIFSFGLSCWVIPVLTNPIMLVSGSLCPSILAWLEPGSRTRWAKQAIQLASRLQAEVLGPLEAEPRRAGAP